MGGAVGTWSDSGDDRGQNITDTCQKDSTRNDCSERNNDRKTTFKITGYPRQCLCHFSLSLVLSFVALVLSLCVFGRSRDVTCALLP